jgi:hypothetical protein
MRRLAVAAKIAVTALLIALVARAFDLRGVGDYLSRVDAPTALALVAVAIGVLPLQAWRWLMVLDVAASRLRFGRALVIVLIGHFFNQTLPSTVGGDAMRMWYAYQAGVAPGNAAATVIFDRLIAVSGLLVLTACGLPWLLELVPDAPARSAIAAVVAAGFGGFALAIALAHFPRLIPDWRIARGFAARARALVASPLTVLAGALISAAGFVAFSWMVFHLAQAVGVRLTFTHSLLLVPPVLLIAAVPVSLAGWGVREGAMVVALGFVGVEPAAAFALSVLFGLAIAVSSLPGALLWLAGGHPARDARQAAEFAEASRDEDPPATR